MSSSTAIEEEQQRFDWSSGSLDGLPPLLPQKPYLMFNAPPNERPYDRKLRMLEQLKRTCMACSCCELGRKPLVRRDHVECDPHVFSNMNPQRFIVYGQNPGRTEVAEGLPFVGDAGVNFNTELTRHGLSRDDFYIANTVRCFTQDNARPLQEHSDRCEPFLRIEINLIRPLLVVALGSMAFERLCPGVDFTASLGECRRSATYEVPVFAVYHPSPRNMETPGRLRDFKEQMRLVCGVVKKLKEVHNL